MNGEFDLAFAEKILMLTYSINHLRKCYFTLLGIINNIKKYKIRVDEFVERTFYKELRDYVYNEMIIHVVKNYHCKPYLYFPNENDFIKFIIFLELYRFKTFQPLKKFCLEIRLKKIILDSGDVFEETVCENLFFQVAFSIFGRLDDREQEQFVELHENFNVYFDSCKNCETFKYWSEFFYNRDCAYRRWFLH